MFLMYPLRSTFPVGKGYRTEDVFPWLTSLRWYEPDFSAKNSKASIFPEVAR